MPPDAPVRTFGPTERPKLAFPRAAPWVAVAAVLVAIPLARDRSDTEWWIVQVLAVAAGLSGAAVGHWAEDRAFGALAARSTGVRLVATAGLAVAALAVGCPLVVLADLTGYVLHDDGTVAFAVIGAAFWFAAAAWGSFDVLVVDGLARVVAPGLKARIALVVLVIGLTYGGLAVAHWEAIRRLVEVISESPSEQITLDLGAGPVPEDAERFLLRDPDFQGELALFLVATFAMLATPTIMSACNKFADTVLERVWPLGAAFDAVAHGDLDVRVDEGGSREFQGLARTFNRTVETLALARRLERTFGAYVSEPVLQRIRAQHGEAALPAELRPATVFFCDVRGFTTMSERLPPARVLEVLNLWFERAVPVVQAYEGYLDKFVGDAVVVVFNGPVEQADHAARAVRCALALQEACVALCASGELGDAGPIKVGVGIASGPLVAGNLGTSRQMSYTVIGDTVNVAARLCGLAPGGEVWVNEVTAAALPADIPRVPLEPLQVKGRAAPVTPHRIGGARA